MKNAVTVAATLLLLTLIRLHPVPAVRSYAATPQELYFVDAHGHVDEDNQTAEKILILRMDQAKVYRTIMSSRRQILDMYVADFARRYPERIIPAVTTMGGDYERPPSGNIFPFLRRLERQVASGRFRAMGEVLVYHAYKPQYGSEAPEISVLPVDPRVQTALRYAIEQKWPFIVHIEFGSLSGGRRTGFMQLFEDMLTAHPTHPFVLTHIGQLDAAEVRRLIQAHENIYFHTGSNDPPTSQSRPWVNVFEGGGFAPQWKDLFVAFPDRFIFALDVVFTQDWTSDIYLRRVGYWQRALSALPSGAANTIAHGNAERLWSLPPKPQ